MLHWIRNQPFQSLLLEFGEASNIFDYVNCYLLVSLGTSLKPKSLSLRHNNFMWTTHLLKLFLLNVGFYHTCRCLLIRIWYVRSFMPLVLVFTLNLSTSSPCENKVQGEGAGSWLARCKLLGSKELWTNVLELHFAMLANHNQNVLVLFRLTQSMCLYVKLESSYRRIYYVNLLGSIDWELDSIDRKSM